MKKTFILSLVLASFLLSSCAKVYYSPEAYKRSQTHEIIAIAPPSVSIKAKKDIDVGSMKEQQKSESLNFQHEMYSWLLHRKSQNKFDVEVLDVQTTNAKLKKAGYFDENPMSPSEVCEVLGVDALLTSRYSLSKPMSEGAAIAVGIIAGYWGSTNKTTVDLELHDRKTKKLLWNYNHEASGGVGSSQAQLVDQLMRSASRKMPYKSK